MLVELQGRVDPRHLRQLSGGRVHPKLLRRKFPFRVDALKVVNRVPAVTAPCQSRLLQALRERRANLDGRWTPPWWIVDDRRVGAQEHQVVRRGWPRHIGVVVVAEGEPPRVRKIRWDVPLDELLADRGRL